MSEDGVFNHSECEALPSRMTIEYFNQFVIKMGTKLMYLSNLSENRFQTFHQKLHRLESALTLIEKKLGLGRLDVIFTGDCMYQFYNNPPPSPRGCNFPPNPPN